MKKKSTKHTICININTGIIDVLKELAIKEDRSISYTAEQLFIIGLAQKEREYGKIKN